MSNPLYRREAETASYSGKTRVDDEGKKISNESSLPAVGFLALVLLVPVVMAVSVPFISISKEPSLAVFYTGVAFLVLALGIVIGVIIKMVASWPDFPMRIYLSSYFPLLLGVGLVSLSENNNVKC